MATDFLADPLWYKDAVIYELHVRSFFDANDDGYGDFEGLRQRLPYLEGLGVNTLWLLPFLESPLRDDGYDTADYYKVLPVHGSLEDFQAFLAEAHARGMRVITELVLNHTSDQHPWFQQARDPASPKHDWYVWSETGEEYAEARIIFTDTEVSNWSWDHKAQKYYWHRFFSHQPDLNFDNPDVRRAMKEVMFFWLDMGVDGLRLDAVPYLYEREGTNCENLPETIDYIVELRRAVEERYGPGKVLLAEANQWPEDTLPYFAGGRGVQMAFNFPIMPRLYMALRRENRRPLVEMLELTQGIPEEAQWAIFLRNHDELTLEMVTDEERDYMWNEYAAEKRFRINVGIRRRLAPLLGGERRRIELMKALLLALPGSPVLYYGDEIGMGDDPFLGDRNGVRTPMQWSPDKNGGFSRAPHHRLFLPAIHQGPYSYEFVNVEDAEEDPHSLLHFTRRLLALRRQHARAFGRGTFRLLPVENPAVLAFIREHEGEQVLVVANLSRFAQSVLLPPEEDLRGLVPVELVGQAAFPPLSEAPYHLTMGPHGFFWFALEPEEAAAAPAPPGPAEADALPVLAVPEGLQNLLVRTLAAGPGRERLEALLPEFLRAQRWFGAKDEAIEGVHVEDALRLQAEPMPAYLAVLRVELAGRQERYLLPLALAAGERAERVRAERPAAALAWVEGPGGRRLLLDATAEPAFWSLLFAWWQRGGRGRSLLGVYAAEADEALAEHRAERAEPLDAEQTNSAALLDGRYFMKLYRRMESGPSAEPELLRHLTREGFRFTPRLHGTLSFSRAEERYVIGVIQEALPVEAEAWDYAREVMGRFLDRVAETAPAADGLPTTYAESPPAWLEELAPEALQLARVLGIRTAEMHAALAEAEAPELRPEPGTTEDNRRLAERIEAEMDQTRRLIEEYDGETDHGRLEGLPTEADWAAAAERLDVLRNLEAPRQRIRIHGDYHLGQLVLARGEFHILDFEGEPARPLEERRHRSHALRDVAGMLRSLDYAALFALREHEEADGDLAAWTARLARWLEAAFLDAYFHAAGEDAFARPAATRMPLLWAYLLDKALYEARYELSHRPDWAHLPLEGLRRLLAADIPPSPGPAETMPPAGGGPWTIQD